MLSRTSRFLLVAAALAVAAFVLVELPRRRAEDRAAREGSRLADLDPARVDAVTIERPADTLSFALRATHWEMTAPVADLAEPSSVLSLLHAIETATAGRRLGPALNGSRFGLDPPAASIALAAAADTLLRLELGGYTVDRAWVYGRVASGEVLLVPTDLLRASTLPADEYRNRHVVVFDRAVVREFRVRAAGASMRWTRGRAPAWFTVLGRDTVPGDSVAVEAMLRRLRGLRVRAFAAAADTAGAFRDPAGVVALVKAGDAPTVTLRFARRPDGAWWARNDAETRVVEVEGGVDDLLAQTTTSLRDRRLLHFSPAQSSRIEFASPDTAGVLVRAGGAWARANPALGPVDAERAADFIRALRALQWVEVAPPGERVPPVRPAFSLVVYGSGDTIIAELRAWPRPHEPARWVAPGPSPAAPRLVDAASLARLTDLFRRIR
jgi:hypothetical protein